MERIIPTDKKVQHESRDHEQRPKFLRLLFKRGSLLVELFGDTGDIRFMGALLVIAGLVAFALWRVF